MPSFESKHRMGIMTHPQDIGSTETLLRCLDLAIEASAMTYDLDPDIASFAMMAALALAERLAIGDDAAYRMRDSAIAELRKKQGQKTGSG